MEKQRKISVSVVIPAYNSSKTIKECLLSVTKQECNFEFEVVVIDDGSSDNTKNIIKDFAKVKYKYQRNSGPAKARNTGWKAAVGDFIVFTDSDCVPEENWLIEMVKPFSLGNEVGAVGGAYDKTMNSEKKLAVLIGEEIKYRYSNIDTWTDAHGSYSLAVRKEVLKKVNGFDESYPVATAEDWDLCYKINKAGYKIYFNQKAKVGHYHPTNLWRYLKTQYRHGFYRMKLYRKHPEKKKGDKYTGSAKWMIILSGLLIVNILLVLLRVQYFDFLLLINVLLILFLQKDLFLFVSRKRGNLDSVSVVVLQLFRGWAWAFGAFKGLTNIYDCNK